MTRPRNVNEPLPDGVAGARTHLGATVAELSERGAGVLLVLLRHAGCPFCREAVADLAQQREAIEEEGVTIVLVHQGDDSSGQHHFEKHGLGDVHRIADPERSLFRAMHLRRGNLWQIGGPKVWVRSLLAALRGHVPGRAEGDAFQMPGTFRIRDRRVVMAYRHASQADRPSYDAMACSV